MDDIGEWLGESSLKPSYPRVSAKYEAIKNNHSSNIG